MSLDTSKLGVKTFTVKVSDDTQLIIKPSSWKDLEDIQILQYQILEVCWNANGSPGDILNPNNKDFWSPAKKLASILPVVGYEEKGFDPALIEDPDELIRVFITNTTHRDDVSGFITPGEDTVLLPSEVSRINGINFTRLLTKLLKSQEKKRNTSQI